MKYVQKAFLDGTFMCVPSFLVCAHLTTFVHAHLDSGHSLEGTFLTKRYDSNLDVKHNLGKHNSSLS